VKQLQMPQAALVHFSFPVAVPETDVAMLQMPQAALVHFSHSIEVSLN